MFGVQGLGFRVQDVGLYWVRNSNKMENQMGHRIESKLGLYSDPYEGM